ncbi:MAG: ATP-binding protein [Bacteroidota bacterium]
MNKFIFLFVPLFFFHQTPKNPNRICQEAIRSGDLQKLSKHVKNLDSSSFETKCIKWEYQLLKAGINDSILHKEILNYNPKSINEEILKNLHLGEYFIHKNSQDKSYKFFKESFLKSTKKNDSLMTCKSLYSLLQLITKNQTLKERSYQLIAQYQNFAYNDLEKAYAEYYSLYFQNTKNIDSLQDGITLAKKSRSEFCLLEYYQRLGVIFDVYLKNPDSAKLYYEKVLRIVDERNNFYFFKQRKKGILNNLGCISYDLGKYRESIDYFKKAYQIPSTKKRLMNDSVILDWHVKAYEKINLIDSAYYYSKKKDSVSRILDQLNYASKINEIETKYNVSELERKNLISEKKRILDKNIYIISGLVLIAFLIISFLVIQNLKRKKRISDQERSIQQEKIDNLIKKQELASIDAMIKGQEKERQIIANDLHDSLGSLLATLKLFIQNFSVKSNRIDNQNRVMVEKANEVLDEAYMKVRNMAHSKNAGLMANEGLIPAIKNFATKVSKTSGIVIEIDDLAMDTRLDNSLEITIFRILQELITNVIKHARATEAFIYFTSFEDRLNIMVEDDGIGFNIETTNLDQGMGLDSIQKRIKSLNGDIKFDSKINKGTSIIIDIPM